MSKQKIPPFADPEEDRPIRQYDLDPAAEHNIGAVLCYASLMTRFFKGIDAHRHDHLELVYVQKGSCVLCLEEESFTLRAGDVFIVDADRLHYEREAEDREVAIYYLGIRGSGCSEDKIMDFLNTAGHPVVCASPLRDILDPLISELFFEAKAQPAFFHQNTACLLTSLLLFLARLNREPGSRPISTYCKKIIDYVETNFYKPLTLDMLSGELHLSKYYLSHIFKSQLSVSPIGYLIEKRISEAEKLLRSSDLPVSEIAQGVGYSDPLYFSRLFKKLRGLSPQQLRDQARKGSRSSAP